MQIALAFYDESFSILNWDSIAVTETAEYKWIDVWQMFHQGPHFISVRIAYQPSWITYQKFTEDMIAILAFPKYD